MKSHTKYLTFETQKRREYLNITAEVAAAVAESGIAEGLALVSAMHITASVYVNDAEDGLIADIDCRSPKDASIWVPGSRCTMRNSTAGVLNR